MRNFLCMSTMTLMLLGCSDQGIPLQPSMQVSDNRIISVLTDKYSYSPSEKINIQLHNGSTASIYLGHCNYRIGFWIERRINDTWVETGSVAVLCQALYPSGTTVLSTNALWRDTITITDPGIYRFRYQFDAPALQITAGSLVTNQFTIQ